MTAIVVKQFGGEKPQRGVRNLDPTDSSYAVNCRLGSGEIRPLHTPSLIESFTPDTLDILYAFRVYDDDGNEEWLTFTDDEVKFISGILAKDRYNRYYWTSTYNPADTPADRYLSVVTGFDITNSLAMADNQVNGYRVGVPAPRFAPQIISAIHLPHTHVPRWESYTTGRAHAEGQYGGRPGDIVYENFGSNKYWRVPGHVNHISLDGVNFVFTTALCGGSLASPSYVWSGINPEDNRRCLEIQQSVLPSFSTLEDLLDTTYAEADPGDYGYVENDLDPDNNGWYVTCYHHSSTASGAIPRKFWKKLSGEKYIRAWGGGSGTYNSGVEIQRPLHEEGHEKYQADPKINIWYGELIEGFISNITQTYNDVAYTSGGEPLVYKGDLAFASTPANTWPSRPEEFWGWYYVAEDPHHPVTGVAATGRDPREYVVPLNGKFNFEANSLVEFPQYQPWDSDQNSKAEMVTRAYVYTFVNAFGEEGPPSPPQSANMIDNEGWALTNFDMELIDNDSDYIGGAKGRVPITSINVYRSITTPSGNFDYWFVGEIPINSNMYSDTSHTGVRTTIPNMPMEIDYITDQESEFISSAHPGVKYSDWAVTTYDTSLEGINPMDTAVAIPYIYAGTNTSIGGMRFANHKRWRATVSDNKNNVDTSETSNTYWTNNLADGVYGYEWHLGTPQPYDITQGDLVFIDRVSTEDVAQSDVLKSYNWYEPPVNLKGLVAHPSGFLVAFKDKDVYFSEPYRPHAFPEGYVIRVQHNIVSISIVGKTIVVLTNGPPYFLYGSHPSTISRRMHNEAVPCTNFKAVTLLPSAVVWSSYDGLYSTNGEVVTKITDGVYGADEWDALNPTGQTLASDRQSILVFYNTDPGFLEIPVGLMLPISSFGGITQIIATTAGSPITEVQNVQVDPNTREAYLISDNGVYWFDPVSAAPIEYTWISKQFTLPDPTNLGALDIGWRSRSFPRLSDAYTGTALTITVYADRILLTTPPATERQTVIDVAARAEGTLLVAQRPIRLRSGFKSQDWAFVLVGDVVVEYVKIAETGKDLEGV